MFNTPPKIVLWATVMVLLAGCARASSSASTETVPLYLEEVVPPCVPTESEPDPCPPDLPAPIIESNGQRLAILMREVPSFTERLLWDPDDDGIIQVHIVVRGIVKKNTTRCDLYRAKVPDYMVKEFQITRIVDQYIVDYYHYSCFANVAVKEYLVGEGPPILTILLDLVALDASDLDSERKISDVLEYHGNPEIKAASYEGREIIFFLGPAPSIEVEAWAGLGGGNMWFLQQTEDDIRAVAEYYTRAVREEHRQKLNLSLEEMVEEIKQAAKNRTTITGGRIGNDPNLPMYITDANTLRDYYIEVGAVYDATDRATKLPPPVPGESDPPAPTIPTNEGTTGTTVPAPGEEPTLPPPTDDAGLSVGQETTTTALPAGDGIPPTEGNEPGGEPEPASPVDESEN